MNLYIQVVIYNKKMIESATLSTLRNQKKNDIDNTNLFLNIHDNSTYSCIDIDVISKLNDIYHTQYVHTPENKTLREIYNIAIDSLNKEDVILLLDDDTFLPPNYISLLLCYLAKYKDNILFAPKVIVDNKMYSPYKSYSFISRPLNHISPGKIESNRHAFINSGLAIRGEFFIKSKFRYPKEVDFYGTDTIFSHVFRENEKSYILMNLTISHDVNNHPKNMSAKNYASALSKVMRFWLLHLHGLSKFLYILYMFFYMLKMTFKFRDMIFIKTFMDLK